MKTLIKLAPVVGVVALLAACGQTMEQRAASGALGGGRRGHRRRGRRGDASALSQVRPRG